MVCDGGFAVTTCDGSGGAVSVEPCGDGYVCEPGSQCVMPQAATVVGSEPVLGVRADGSFVFASNGPYPGSAVARRFDTFGAPHQDQPEAVSWPRFSNDARMEMRGDGYGFIASFHQMCVGCAFRTQAMVVRPDLSVIPIAELLTSPLRLCNIDGLEDHA